MNLFKTLLAIAVLATSANATLLKSLNLGPYSYTNITCTSQVASDCDFITMSGKYNQDAYSAAGAAVIVFMDNQGRTPGDTIDISYDLAYAAKNPAYLGLGFLQGFSPIVYPEFEGGLISGISGGIVGTPLEPDDFSNSYVGSGPSLNYEYSISLLPYSGGLDGELVLLDAAVVDTSEPSSFSYTSPLCAVGLLVTIQQIRRTRRVGV